MPASEQIPPYMETNDLPQPSPAGATRWYVIGLVLLPLTAIAFMVWATTRPWFINHDNYDFGAVMGYSLRAANLNCEIVIYGDSTALAGLDPSVIQERTGLKVCNISEIRPVQDTVGVSFPLDQYLAHNQTPRYLVTSWALGIFNLDHPRMLSPRQDGYLYALQHDRGTWLWVGALTHPASFLSFLNWAMSSLLEDTAKSLVGKSIRQVGPDLRAARDTHAGMFTFSNIPEQRCSKSEDMPVTTYDSNLRAISAFRKHYETNGTRVIVNASPIADCVEDLNKLRSLTLGLVDNQIFVLPIQYFDIDNIHLVRAGAELYSQKVADQILEEMQHGKAQQAVQPSRSVFGSER